MIRWGCLLSLVCVCAGPLAADDEKIVFRSDVALMRVDARVVDRGNRTITGLARGDFILRDDGHKQEIRNFGSEDMPLDVLFLLDVSASMRPHVQRIADAAHEALTVMRDDDRMAIMVFDTSPRIRMPFRKGRLNVEREFENLLRQESFHGGTQITRAMLYAARYLGTEGRRDARRAIVILTDDETQGERDDIGVLASLDRSETVMSALIAPDAMGTRGGMGRGYPRSGGGGWPGGPTIGGGGPIILGRRGGYGGHSPGVYARTHSAGTAEIARQSGGDSMPVDNASSLEDTLSRLRQRYALHFYLPADVRSGQTRNLEIQLTAAALRRYPDAEVRYRHSYRVPEGASPGPGTAIANDPGNADPVVVTRASSSPDTPQEPAPATRRRRAVNEDGTSVDAGPAQAATPMAQESKPLPAAAPDMAPKPASRGWRRVDDSSPAQGPIVDKDTKDSPPKPGWPKKDDKQ